MEKTEEFPGEILMILELVGQNHKGTQHLGQMLNVPENLGEVARFLVSLMKLQEI